MTVLQVVRSLWRAKGTLVVVVLTVGASAGFGVGAANVAHATFWAPLTFDKSGAVVVVDEAKAAAILKQAAPGDRPFQAFERAARFHSGEATVTSGAALPLRARVSQVSLEFFRVVEVSASTGRSLSGYGPSMPVAVATDSLLRRLNLSTAALGAGINVNGHPLTLVGVIPAEGAFPAGTDLWLPEGAAGESIFRGAINYRVLARLAPGVAPEAAEAELRVKVRSDSRERRLRPLRAALTERSMPAVGATLLASLAVLLAAGVNVVHLLLARATERRSTYAVCTVLGAKPADIFKVIAIEQMVLFGLSGAFAWVSAHWFHRFILYVLPADALGLSYTSLDWRTGFLLLGALGAMAAACLLALYVWILRPGRLSGPQLQDVDTRVVGRARGARWLIGAEVTAAVAVGALATVLVDDVTRILARGREGIRRGVHMANIELPDTTSAQADRFFLGLLERLRSSPRVRRAALVSAPPFLDSATLQLRFSGVAAAEPSAPAEYRIVDGAYFDVMDIPVLSGRTCTNHDRAGTQKVAMVSANVAEKLWGRSNALGQRIGFVGAPPGFAYEVVGVVGPTRHRDLLDDSTDAAVYTCFGQEPGPYMTVMVESEGTRADVTSLLGESIRSIDPRIAAGAVRTVDEARRESVRERMSSALLTSVLASYALVLVGLGVYAILAFDVRGRRREIAVRLSCGASSARLLKDLLRPVALCVLAGASLGALLAFWLLAAATKVLVDVPERGATLPILGAAVGVATLALALAAYSIKRSEAVDPAELLRGQV